MADSLVHRVQVFVDFWNYTLLMKSVEEGYVTDWKVIGPRLADQAGTMVSETIPSIFQGLNFYGSYDPKSPKDRKLRHWATNVVGKFAGVDVSMVPRQKRSCPRCPSCHSEVVKCPNCQASMQGTEEKGVDVRIATDMIRLAWVDNYDIAVLVTSDKDLIPAVEFLKTRGIKVIHGSFPQGGHELTKKCWDQIKMAREREKFRR